MRLRYPSAQGLELLEIEQEDKENNNVMLTNPMLKGRMSSKPTSSSSKPGGGRNNLNAASNSSSRGPSSTRANMKLRDNNNMVTVPRVKNATITKMMEDDISEVVDPLRTTQKFGNSLNDCYDFADGPVRSQMRKTAKPSCIISGDRGSVGFVDGPGSSRDQYSSSISNNKNVSYPSERSNAPLRPSEQRSNGPIRSIGTMKRNYEGGMNGSIRGARGGKQEQRHQDQRPLHVPSPEEELLDDVLATLNSNNPTSFFENKSINELNDDEFLAIASREMDRFILEEERKASATDNLPTSGFMPKPRTSKNNLQTTTTSFWKKNLAGSSTKSKSDVVSMGQRYRQGWGGDRFLKNKGRKFDVKNRELKGADHDGVMRAEGRMIRPTYIPPHEKRRDDLRMAIRAKMSG